MYNVRYWDGAPTPLYPFGHGLSYTTFSFANLKVAAPRVKAGATAAVTVDVTNTGSVAGDEVVQLYVHQRAGSDSRPLRELKGFRRVSLEPSETQAVTFSLGPEELRYWSTSQREVGAGRGSVRRLGGRGLDRDAPRGAPGRPLTPGNP